MPSPNRSEAGSKLTTNLLLDREPGTSPGEDFERVQVETNKRHSAQGSATAAAVKALAAPVSPAPAFTPVPAQPPPSQLGPDRWHKEAAGVDGGYIVLSPNHDPSETDQYPPLNSGYLYQAALPSLLDAYNKAVVMTRLMKSPNARVKIEIHGGVWNIGQLLVNRSGVDIIGIGRPSLLGQITIGPTSDMCVHGIKFYCPPTITNGALFTVGFLNPQASPLLYQNSFYDCEFYSDTIGSVFQRPFYAERCHWYQTSNANGLDEIVLPLVIQANGFDTIASRMQSCSIHSWLTAPDINARGPLDRHPGGYALSFSVPGQGSFNTSSGDGPFAWATPKLILDNCDIFGSLLVNQGDVEHDHCRVHGAIPIPTTTGQIYASLRGQPLFDSTNGYIGSALAIARFDHCKVNSGQIAQATIWNGQYPVGITPATYPGECYVQFFNSSHRCRYDGAAAEAFSVLGQGLGIADIANSITGAAAWSSATITANLYGSCPTGVPAQDFYLM